MLIVYQQKSDSFNTQILTRITFNKSDVCKDRLKELQVNITIDKHHRNQAMTKAEREVILDLTPNEMREFSEENCETYIRLRVKEAYPNIFGSLKPKWLIWDSANLVNISDINEDNVNYEQKPRATINSMIQQLRSLDASLIGNIFMNESRLKEEA